MITMMIVCSFSVPRYFWFLLFLGKLEFLLYELWSDQSIEAVVVRG